MRPQIRPALALLPPIARCALLLAFASPSPAADWPRFRGPNGSGVPEEETELPVEFGPGRNLLWSTPLPPGISSPVAAGARIYVTAVRGKELLTIALARKDGKVLWERKAPAEVLEEVHSTSSPASASVASDGQRAVAFFGSSGLVAYDPDGKELWKVPLGPFKNNYGEAASPVIAGDLVILNCDQDQASFLIAVEKGTGKVRYRVERPEFPRGYSTPVIWKEGTQERILVAGTLHLKAYAIEDGHEIASAPGLARIVNPTPVLGDGLIFVSSFAPGGDTEGRISMPTFDEFAKANDKDGDGRFSEGEVPAGPMKDRFRQLDADKDGFITRAEWENMARIFESAHNGILALRPDPAAKGGLALVWSYGKAIPYVPSPILYRGAVYLVKDGGIVTALEAKSGKLLKEGRVGRQGGGYYASPVASGGKILLLSLDGEATIISAEADWKQLAVNPLGERCVATPAIVDGRLLVRTDKRLMAFSSGHP